MKKIILILIALLGSQFANAQLLQLRSKVDVTLNVVSLTQGKVRMIVDEESRNGLAIYVRGRYVEDATGDLIKSFSYTVENEQANQLGAVPIPNGTSLIDTRNMQLYAGTMSVIQGWKDFGLSASQWEIYVAPKPIEE